MMITRKQFLLGSLASLTTSVLLEACSSDDDQGRESFGEGDGDGDDDPSSTGDGDGDPTTTGDGDGDPTTGDGDGDGDGEGDGDGDGDADTCPAGASGTITQNHAHVLLIPQADILAGTQKTYDIKGGANHSHTVTLTADDFTTLALGVTVEKVSSFLQGHSHQVFIGCL